MVPSARSRNKTLFYFMFKPIDAKPNFPELEESILKFWEDNKIFEKTLEKTKNGEPFTFYDGPPFATGLPHYGHILASTIKDLIPRYQTMKGRLVRRRWGWDCHGLPIEEIVERKLGISGKKQIEEIGIEKFNEICRGMVLQYVAEWRKMVRRIGRWIEFDDSYKTMDRDYMESVWWAFKQIYDKGLVYEGRKVLLYCPRCETPISNFEVAMDNSYQEVTEEAVTVKFRIKDLGLKIKDKEKSITYNLQPTTFLLAWTTTPWTLPGNVALAVGEDIDYVKVKVGDEFYILAKDRIKQLFEDTAKFDDRTKQVYKGSDLVGLEYESLFEVPAVKSDKTFRVYAADFVNTEEGTGIVHTAVVYGEEDYALGLKEGLPVVPLLDEKGKFNALAPKLIQGQYFKDSEKLIKKDLEERGLIFEKKAHTHSYPHCWRCGTTLFYNAIPAWFVKVQDIKEDLLATNETQVNWYPSHLKHGRYAKSVESAPDWNISRNRFWGNPIPVWKCKDCNHIKVVGSIKELKLSANTFYFARHGRSENNDLRLNDSWPDIMHYPLTEKGITQSELGAEKLEQLGGLDLIFSSDITRCKQTAEIYSKVLKAEIKFDERLREVQCGIYNGKTYEEIWKYFSFEDRWSKAPEGGETNKQVQDRMVEFIQEINKKYKDKKILVVSHGDPLLVLQKYFGSEREYPKYSEPFEIDVSIPDLHRPYIDDVVLKCEECGGEAHRISEIFDSWVEAGSMPFAEYHYPFDQKKLFESRFPGQFVAEYIAQTRAWFYVMHVISQILFNRAPFQNVVTTGNVLNEKGEKLSKSKKNYPDPWVTIDKYGVDALRFYLMNSVVMQGDDINFSEKDLAVIYRKNILILWNVLNYFVTYANEAGWEPVVEEIKPKIVLDQWIVSKTQELVNNVTANLDGYNTAKTTRVIEEYINELSTWYVRRSRGRKDGDFFATLRYGLLVLSKVIAPVMPYMAEIIYGNLNRKKEVPSVHLADWPEKKSLTEQQTALLKNMDLTKELVELGHSDRKSKNIKLRQVLVSGVYSTVTARPLDEEFEEIMQQELNTKNKFEFSSVKENKVELDPNISQDLRIEGLARELERKVQDMRKQAGFQVGEMANLSYDTSDEDLKTALSLFDRNKTYVKEITVSKGGEETEIESKKIRLLILKA